MGVDCMTGVSLSGTDLCCLAWQIWSRTCCGPDLCGIFVDAPVAVSPVALARLAGTSGEVRCRRVRVVAQFR